MRSKLPLPVLLVGGPTFAVMLAALINGLCIFYNPGVNLLPTQPTVWETISIVVAAIGMFVGFIYAIALCFWALALMSEFVKWLCGGDISEKPESKEDDEITLYN